MQRHHPAAELLRPAAAAFCGLAAIRRRWLSARPGDVVGTPPVIVVGSIFVGGSGKTPLVIALIGLIRECGLRPGVVLRGYRGRARHWPQAVGASSDPVQVGDEAVLIARRTGAPVVAGADRCAALRLLAKSGCELAIADDGLQHYRMPRAAEIVVLDHCRGLGNGLCLPAGPLREPATRLPQVDMVIGNGGPVAGYDYSFRLTTGALTGVSSGPAGKPPDPGETLHAVAGIGDPERFFTMLEAMGFGIHRHAFPDHYRFRPADLQFGDEVPIVMTEKDAVKCSPWAPSNSFYLPVDAALDASAGAALRGLVRRVSCERAVTHG